MTRPLQRSDVGDQFKLYQYLKELEQKNDDLTRQVKELSGARTTSAISTTPGTSTTSTPTPLELTTALLRQIRDGLSVTGAAPLSLDGLPGLPGQSADDLLTTDTAQTITSTGIKTVQAAWLWQVAQNIVASLDGALGWGVTNTSAGTGANAGNFYVNNTTQGGLVALFGSNKAGTRYGVSLAKAFEVLGYSGILAMLLGTTDNAPIVFGQNSVERGRITSTGWTFGGGTDLNGAKAALVWTAEELTLSTVGTTTDTAANLLPGNAVVLGMVARVTTAITTAASVQIGDATTATRFATLGTMTLGTTLLGLNHLQGGVATDATGPVQFTAAKIRTTANVTPGAGKVRLVTLALVFTPPTS